MAILKHILKGPGQLIWSFEISRSKSFVFLRHPIFIFQIYSMTSLLKNNKNLSCWVSICPKITIQIYMLFQNIIVRFFSFFDQVLYLHIFINTFNTLFTHISECYFSVWNFFSKCLFKFVDGGKVGFLLLVFEITCSLRLH